MVPKSWLGGSCEVVIRNESIKGTFAICLASKRTMPMDVHFRYRNLSPLSARYSKLSSDPVFRRGNLS